MKSNSARKKSSATTAIKLRREIKLDESQMAIYKTGTIDILDPTGEPIDVIGQPTKQLNELGSREDLANSLRLIEELLLSSHDGIQLSAFAVAGLAETLSRAERMIE